MANAAKDVMLEVGKKVPEIALEGAHGTVTLAKLRGPAPGKYVVLYFYPKDNTPGCTREGQAFSASSSAFAKAGAVVVGVSKDTPKTHASFATSCGITVPLLSDTDLTAHKVYGAYGEKKSYGRVTVGTIRSTFIVAPDGTLVRAFRGVKVDGHADAVLSAVLAHKDGGAAGATPKKPAKAPATKGSRAKSAR